MNNDIYTPTWYRLGLALLFCTFLVSGCASLPGEIRHDTSTRTYAIGEDGRERNSVASGQEPRTNTYRVDQYQDATAYYILRQGNRPPAQPGLKQAKTAAYQPESAAAPPEEQLAEMPLVLEVTDVLFDFDKWVLKPNVLPELDQWADFFKKHPQVQGEIRGHADSTGPNAYNLELSRKRALAVVNYLVRKGVDGKMLTARGFGETQPIAPNTTREGRQKNRRVELDL